MYVLMVTPNKFPNGDAGAVRDEYFAKIYKELGYKVYHIGMGLDSGIYNGVNYFSLPNNKSKMDKIINFFNYKKNIQKIYDSIILKEGVSPSLIHIYDIPESGIKWVEKIAKEIKIPVIHDSVEWYSACEFKLGRFSRPYILKNRTNTKLIKKPMSVIAISTFLENYFREKGLNTVRIPVIMDPDDFRPRKRNANDLIKVVYAGSPAKKDYLNECILAYNNLPKSVKKKFVFQIFGVTEDYVKSYLGSNSLPIGMSAFGRVEREQVISCLETSDFSILLRPSSERYAKAGFPTKSVEAMMSGCAMICNISSDLGMYLNDGINSILVGDSTVSDMYQAFIRVSEMKHEELVLLRNSARTTAELNFYYKLFIDDLRKLIELDR